MVRLPAIASHSRLPLSAFSFPALGTPGRVELLAVAVAVATLAVVALVSVAAVPVAVAARVSVAPGVVVVVTAAVAARVGVGVLAGWLEIRVIAGVALAGGALIGIVLTTVLLGWLLLPVRLDTEALLLTDEPLKFWLRVTSKVIVARPPLAGKLPRFQVKGATPVGAGWAEI